jgi:hypothetical protein
MKHTFFLLVFLSLGVQAKKLSDYTPYDYKVFFTNPVCEQYFYETPVLSNDGTVLEAKPKNVYCKKADDERNAKRADSPHYNILKIIQDPSVHELFMSFLSFSVAEVSTELCRAIEMRDLKLTFIIDSKGGSVNSEFEKLAKCKGKFTPKLLYRGNEGGIGFAHNKIIMTNPSDLKGETTIVFASGNMSAGTTLHHENWHFVKTSKESYFAQAHVCLMKATIDHADKASNFKKFYKECKNKIAVEVEEDIELIAIPGEGKYAMDKIASAMKEATQVDMAAHRFSNKDLIALMKENLPLKKIRLVVDDDIYWTGKRGVQTGANSKNEFFEIMSLLRHGLEVRYMETNQNSRLLHHNKYMLFHNEVGGAVFAGAGNFTVSAFTKNFENFYFITIPEVVETFQKQYAYKWEVLATPYEKLPKEYANP